MSDDKDKAAREYAEAFAQGMYHDQPANIILAQHDYEQGFLAGHDHGRASLARELLEWAQATEHTFHMSYSGWMDMPDGRRGACISGETEPRKIIFVGELRNKLEGEI